MAGQFDLNAKHIECAKKAKEVISNIEGNNAKDRIKSYLEASIGLLPSESNVYDDYLGLAVALEEVSKQDSLSAYALVDQVVFRAILNKYSQLKADSVLSKGETISLLSMEEGFSGVENFKTTAVKSGDEWKIEGSKLVSNEQLFSEKFLVFAKVEDNKFGMFIVPEESTKIKQVEKTISSSKVVYNHIELSHSVKESQCIAVVEDSFEDILAIARTLVAAASVGIAHSAMASSVSTAKSTKNSNGESITNSQNLQFTLADMYTEVEAGRTLTYCAADTIDNGKSAIKMASMAKVKASEAASSVTMQSLQIIGNIGFIANTEFADLIQRSIDSTAKGGTNRLQRSQIYSYMLAKK